MTPKKLLTIAALVVFALLGCADPETPTPRHTATPLPTPHIEVLIDAVFPTNSAAMPTETSVPTATFTKVPTPTLLPTPSTVVIAAPPLLPTPIAVPTATPVSSATSIPTSSPTTVIKPTPTPSPKPFVTTLEPVPTSASESEAFPLELVEITREHFPNHNKITFQGVTTPGVTVGVRQNSTIAGKDGHFILTLPLAVGRYSLDIIAISPAGRAQVKSVVIEGSPIYRIDICGRRSISQPHEADSIVNQPLVRLWGCALIEDRVSVNGVAIPVDSLGLFSTTVALHPGLNTITVDYIGRAGDIQREMISATYQEP